MTPFSDVREWRDLLSRTGKIQEQEELQTDGSEIGREVFFFFTIFSQLPAPACFTLRSFPLSHVCRVTFSLPTSDTSSEMSLNLLLLQDKQH